MKTTSHGVAAGLMGVVLALVVAGPALAHVDLVASDPADGTVSADPPTIVTLTFTEGLDAGKSAFRLIGPGGDVGTGTASRDGSTTMALENLVLAPGDYRIRWTAVGEDGHVERGSLRFTVSTPTPEPATASSPPSAGPSEGATATTVPATEAPAGTVPPASAPTATPAASPAAADGEPAAASDMDIVLPIVVGLVLVAAVGAFVLRRSRGV